MRPEGRVVVIDTGCANLTSLVNAIAREGVDPVVSREPAVIRGASRLFLPGVGTARAAMDTIRSRGLDELVMSATQPVLGICLGMQALCSRSEETGGVELLGVVKADVRLMDAEGLPLPHMGWNETFHEEGAKLFRGIPQGAFFYYVHSYAVSTGPFTIARAEYPRAFSAAIAQDNFAGVQFHPEKSGAVGARLIRNFLEDA